MSEKYKFYDNSQLYFISFSVIHWIDVFIRNEYKYELLTSWEYCTKNKGLQIYAWCIMPSHVHMIISSSKNPLSDIVRDMKSYTSSRLRKVIENNHTESRKDWMLKMMYKAGIQNSNNKDFQFWQQTNHPIELNSNYLMDQRLEYIHNNPVVAGFVDEPEDWLFSSARDYCGKKGLIDIKIIE